MSRRRNGLLLFAFVIFTLWIGLLFPLQTWPTILFHPWRQLWGSGQQLNATLLEASEGEAVKSVSRRLFKPLGNVKLLRVFDTDEKAKTKT